MATVAPGQRELVTARWPLREGAGRAVLDGNELIVKGALEAGVSLITGYPGSPVADVFTICETHAPYLRELGVEAQPGPSWLGGWPSTTPGRRHNPWMPGPSRA
jgi:hypothetical protein